MDNVGRMIVAKLIPDEDLIDTIKEIVMEHEIISGQVNMIGALKKATLGFFNLNKKAYDFKTFEEPLELLSCIGNIAYIQDEPLIHLHATLGREDFSVLGGHLSQPSIISITGEVYISEIEKKISRNQDPHSKLMLIDL